MNPNEKGKLPLISTARIVLDIAGSLPLNEDGNKYMMVIDYFRKSVEGYAIPNSEAADVLIK